jgi:hypothetical protein
MSGIRLDKVVRSTLHEAYRNYASPTGTITIPADTLPNGLTQNYETTINYTRAGTIAHIFAENDTKKYLANGGTRISGRVYTPVSTETASILVGYGSSSITATLSIFNGTGGPITLTAQTITITAVQYDAPITAI